MPFFLRSLDEEIKKAEKNVSLEIDELNSKKQNMKGIYNKSLDDYKKESMKLMERSEEYMKIYRDYIVSNNDTSREKASIIKDITKNYNNSYKEYINDKRLYNIYLSGDVYRYSDKAMYLKYLQKLKTFSNPSLLKNINKNDIEVDSKTKYILTTLKKQYKNALCDSEGFYQHSGECWNDAIQMIFLWTDGLKEVTQKKLAKNEVIQSAFHKFIPYPDLLPYKFKQLVAKSMNLKLDIAKVEYKDDTVLRDFLIKEAILYFKSLQNRFARHYFSEIFRRENNLDASVCPTTKPLDKLFNVHVKGRNAKRGATFGNPFTETFHTNNYSKTVHGATVYQQEYVINMFMFTFFQDSYIHPNEFDSSHETVMYGDITYDIIKTNSIQKLKDINKNKELLAILLNTSDHALCLYTCGNQDFFYEDNFGPILFPWRKYIDKIEGIIFGSLKQVDSNSQHIIREQYYPVIVTSNKYILDYQSDVIEIDKEEFDSGIESIKVSEFKGEKYTFEYIYTGKVVDTFIPIYLNKGFIPRSNKSYITNQGFSFKDKARFNISGPVMGGTRKARKNNNKTLKKNK